MNSIILTKRLSINSNHPGCKLKSAKVKKTFKSITGNLSEIRNFTEDFLISNRVIEEDRENIILAIDEACTNKIKHAYHLDPTNDILISLEIKDQLFIAEISDWGEKFDPDIIPVPNINDNYKNQRKGGYGIYLMKKLMDKIEYEFSKDGENKIILQKEINFEKDE